MAPKSSPKKSSQFTARPRKRVEWTIIILIAAESDIGEDFKEAYDKMATIGSNQGEVNFIVIFDGLNLPGGAGHVTVYNVLRNNFFGDVSANRKYVKRFKQGLDNLTKRENLEEVLEWTRNRFLAKNYGFIYKGHGGVNPDINNTRYFWKAVERRYINGRGEPDSAIAARAEASLPKNSGLEFDSLVTQYQAATRRSGKATLSNRPESRLMALFKSDKRSAKEMTYREMGEVLQKVFCSDDKQKKQGLGFVCLDCCWGQQLETGFAFKDVTQYLVASADEMAIWGIGYDEFCKFLVDQPDIKPCELADLIVSEYFQKEYDDYKTTPEFDYMGVSLTCVETTYLDEIVRLMNQLSDYLIRNMETHFYLIHVARLQCMAYTYKLKEEDYGLYSIDLIWFLENLQFYNRIPNRDANGKSNREPIDTHLDRIISDLLTQLSLYYIKSYLSSNYTVRRPGENLKKRLNEAIVGGKGLGIIFPSKEKHLLDSIYKDSSSAGWLSHCWHWGRFLSAYVKHKEIVRRKNDSVTNEQLKLFKKSKLKKYQKYLECCNGSGGNNGYSLEEKLEAARVCVIQKNIPHKWVKVVGPQDNTIVAKFRQKA